MSSAMNYKSLAHTARVYTCVCVPLLALKEDHLQGASIVCGNMCLRAASAHDDRRL